MGLVFHRTISDSAVIILFVYLQVYKRACDMFVLWNDSCYKNIETPYF